jgi:hypothetical protein
MGEVRASTPPRRLIETDELGPAVRGAAETDFDAERMASNRAALLSKLDDLTFDVPRTLRFPIVSRRAVPALLAGLLFVSVGASAYYYYRAVVVPARDKEIEADTAGDDLPPSSGRRGSGRPRPEEPGALAEPEPEPPEAGIPEADGGPSDSTVGQRRSTRHRPDQRDNAGSVRGLDQQVRLFNEAKALVAAGDHAGGIKRLNELEERFPDGPLGVEDGNPAVRGVTGVCFFLWIIQ